MEKRREIQSDRGRQEEADVVVVGYGGAGAVAAITARDAGAKVIILEKQSPQRHTPNTMMSMGGFHSANDAGEAAKYFAAVAFGIGLPAGFGDPHHIYPQYPTELIDGLVKNWAEGVTGISTFLKSLGDIAFEETIPAPAFPTFPGAQCYGHISVEGGGIALFAHLAKAVGKRGIKILWEHPAERLTFNGRHEITGVQVRRGEGIVTVKARRAVVLASGGFACNDELKQTFLPGWGWTFIGNPGNSGDGLKMAMAAGASLSHMHHSAARVVAGGVIADEIGTGFNIRAGEPGRLLVDNYGRRYCNEQLTSRNPDRYHFYKQVLVYDTSKLEYPRIPSWLIFDEQARKKGPIVLTVYGAHAVGIYRWSEDNSAEIEKGWILKGDSLAELAGRIAAHRDNSGRMNAETLSATIASFNRHCAQGNDPDFGRPAKSLGPLLTPPYYAVAEYPGGPNTEGGPTKNARAQVMDVFGKPIPRLYAAGEIASSWNFLYQGGGNLAECVICGRAAGHNAAMEKPRRKERS